MIIKKEKIKEEIKEFKFEDFEINPKKSKEERNVLFNALYSRFYISSKIDFWKKKKSNNNLSRLLCN